VNDLLVSDSALMNLGGNDSAHVFAKFVLDRLSERSGDGSKTVCWRADPRNVKKTQGNLQCRKHLARLLQGSDERVSDGRGLSTDWGWCWQASRCFSLSNLA